MQNINNNHLHLGLKYELPTLLHLRLLIFLGYIGILPRTPSSKTIFTHRHGSLPCSCKRNNKCRTSTEADSQLYWR